MRPFVTAPASAGREDSLPPLHWRFGSDETAVRDGMPACNAYSAFALRSGFQNPMACQPPGIRRSWRLFPVPLAQGGAHGVKSGGAGGGDHRSDEGWRWGTGRPALPTVEVVETLRFLVREGVSWRELRATAGRA